jgi:hypothetical protein
MPGRSLQTLLYRQILQFFIFYTSQTTEVGSAAEKTSRPLLHLSQIHLLNVIANRSLGQILLKSSCVLQSSSAGYGRILFWVLEVDDPA